MAQLSIKHRPATLATFAGNTALKKQVAAMLSRPFKDIPKVFLLAGGSGMGKTTLARIIAKHVKCDPNEFYELNAASVRGIDTIRDMEKQIRYGSMSGGCRIWLLDEIHQYLAPAQEALLKMLEECPPHVLFMLCTTNPEKLKPTLKGRCVSFEVLPLTDDEMFNMLIGVVEAEQADVPDAILEKILSVAGGSSRNALQLLEKVIDLDVKDMQAVSMEMDTEETIAKDLFDALIKKKPWKEVAGIIKRITVEPETARYSVLGLANSMLLNGYGDPKQAALVIDCFENPFYNSGKAGLTKAAYSVTL
jgi:DNA polymerase III gamma/tau subunit